MSVLLPDTSIFIGQKPQMMSSTNREQFLKSLKFFAYTMVLMFLAPVVIFQAFKNQTHPWYWPVLIVGVVLAIAAIAMGFYSIRLIMRSFFGKEKQ
jgi:NADH:ubiquinone oxidoreductase subunit 5 (subunit L)/multisubunit Na+/H+ antiporter MnhA subunit